MSHAIAAFVENTADPAIDAGIDAVLKKIVPKKRVNKGGQKILLTAASMDEMVRLFIRENKAPEQIMASRPQWKECSKSSILKIVARAKRHSERIGVEPWEYHAECEACAFNYDTGEPGGAKKITSRGSETDD